MGCISLAPAKMNALTSVSPSFLSLSREASSCGSGGRPASFGRVG